MIPFINLEPQLKLMKEQAMRALNRVYDSGHYILGSEGNQFEEEVKKYLQIPYAIGVGNGTDALVLALHALDIGPGDEVITTPFTFFATAESISRVGATPVFVDIEPKTYNIDPANIKKAITKRTKAIMPVHLFGHPAQMDVIMDIAKEHTLYVIEDACQAFGASLNNQKAGTFGDIACFSFYPTKNLGTLGDGGLIVTKHKSISDRIRLLRHHGSTKKYFHKEVGYNSRLDELQAALLRISLTHIDAFNQNRKDIAARYNQELEKINGIGVPTKQLHAEHIYHLYSLDLKNRDAVQAMLNKEDIACGVYYPLPLHLQEVYEDMGYKEGTFPIAEEKSRTLLAIPMHPFLTNKEQQTIIKVIQSGGAGITI
ncbi:DegT/DnrJ/EryC1/StrS family aminotransferase [Alkalicoccobacillus porphyridii]|uniref:DegT/DnrJ/EryC1/StrS family aminotransferase n=1 Tax=Alkalicoccobacillus porphyridii TaxID=2597270 RepID=A0A553ZXA6_9BACI|nr:DegT/DnrJ/EryC1/StrS family aminotransferase [Alkalicoccobacillus porphyridii]